MSKVIEKVNIEVGTSIYNSYKNINVQLENPFKEFIDNTTQSFYDHQKILESDPKFNNLIVRINIKDDKLIVLDNAYGMNKKDFDRALRLGAKSDFYSQGSRSKFGMGLKYAAMYLGDYVEIESTEYGSEEKYYAVLDSQQLDKNIEYVDRIITEALPSEHYTKISISKLRQPYTQKTIDTLIRKLGRIYKFDIEKGLEIIINDNLKVDYEDYKLRFDIETNSQYIDYFGGKFCFNGKEYEYLGWLGILETANVSDAGFSLLQSNRVIKMNYRPEKIFKKSNSFQYQRVVGEINLDGWPVVYNKTDFIWEDGLEEKFIEELRLNKQVAHIIKKSQELRYLDTTKPKEKEIKKVTQSNKKIFEKVKSTPKVQMDLKEEDQDLVGAYVASLDVDADLEISFEGAKYHFEFSYVTENDEDVDLFKIEELDSKERRYRIIIDNKIFKSNLFKIISKNTDRHQFIQALLTVIGITQISSRDAGFKDSYKFTSKLNQVLKALVEKDE